MGYGVKVRIWGDYACFSRPELKVERVSYDCMTPSAAKGFLEAIYWKPAICWKIDKIHIINPIEFTNIRRNEVQQVAKLSSIKKSMKQSQCYDIIAPDVRHQRAAMILRDVEYVIEAHFDINKEHSGETDTPEKHYNIAIRRLKQGQFFQKPFLGTREFSANFEFLETEADIPKSQLQGELDLGYMLHSINYNLTDKKEKISVSPSFFRAVAIDGIINLTKVGEIVS